MENYVSLKPCPVCGEVPERITCSLEGPNGRGYRGCFTYQYKCECCRLVKGGERADISISKEDAINCAKETWNAEVTRVQLLLDRQYVLKTLVENNVI